MANPGPLVGSYFFIFGQNHYDFRNQRPKNAKNTSVLICNSKNAYIGPLLTQMGVFDISHYFGILANLAWARGQKILLLVQNDH